MDRGEILTKYTLFKCLLFISVGSIWFGYIYYSNSYQIDSELLREPIQSIYAKKRMTSAVLGEKNLDIEFISSFTLWGIIVSISNQALIDKSGLINLCLLWGENISLYQQGNYSCWHENGRCMLEIKQGDSNKFMIKNFSNNHVLLPSKGLQNKASALNIGDQIKITGDLVNIKNKGAKDWLNTSTIRDDIGDGACEVILAKKIEILVSNKNSNNILIHIIFLLVLCGLIMLDQPNSLLLKN